MKNKLILFLLFITSFVKAQTVTVREQFAAWANVQGISASGANYVVTISGFSGNPKAHDATFLVSDIQAGDILWTPTCSRFVVVSVSGASITISDPQAGTSVIPVNGERIGLVRESMIGNEQMASLPQSGDGNAGAIAGVNAPTFACMYNHYNQKNIKILQSLNFASDTVVASNSIDISKVGATVTPSLNGIVGATTGQYPVKSATGTLTWVTPLTSSVNSTNANGVTSGWNIIEEVTGTTAVTRTLPATGTDNNGVTNPVKVITYKNNSTQPLTISINTGQLIDGATTSIVIPAGEAKTFQVVGNNQIMTTANLNGSTSLLSTQASTIGSVVYPIGTPLSTIDNALNATKWDLLGNAGTVAGTNFIGTTDNVDVTIKRNNLPELISKGDGIFTVNNNNKRNLFLQYGNTTAGNKTLLGSFNGVIGGNGLNALTTGSFNGVLGGNGLGALTTGNFNGLEQGFGFDALTTGSHNAVSKGYGLYALTTGNYNGVTQGYGLYALSTGNHNGVDKGYGLYALTAGSYNGVDKGFGLDALTTGNNNGINKGYGLYSLTTGSYNAVNEGYGLNSLTTGNHNGVDKGYGLFALSVGSYNGLDKGFGLDVLTNNSNVAMIGENNDLAHTSIANILFSNLTFTNATFNLTVGGTPKNGSIVTGADVTSIIAANIAAGRVLNTLGTLDADKQTVPFYNPNYGWTAGWMMDANTLFIPIAGITGGTTNLYTSPTFNNIFMVGRNIRATKSNQFIIGGEGTTEVKFRGESGYNYAHDVSAVLTAADDAKVWTYDHATTSIKMKPVLGVAVNPQISPANGSTATIDWGSKVVNYQSVASPATVTLTYTNALAGAMYDIVIAPSGASSVVTFQTGRFVENGALVAPKTISAYTVLRVHQLTATSAEIVDVYSPSTSSIQKYSVGSGAIVKATGLGVTFTRTTASVWTFNIPAGVELLSFSIHSLAAENPGVNVTLNFNYTANSVSNIDFATVDVPNMSIWNMQSVSYAQSTTGGAATSSFRPVINSVSGGSMSIVAQLGSAAGALETMIKGNF